jgi:anti-sigma-K factor RskA
VAGLAPAPDADVALSVAYEPRGRSLIVNAAALDRTAQRDHQLWIIPAGGQPVALGLVRSGGRHRLEVPRELTPHFRSESVVAVSLEPLGGSPTGQPTGPVLASGPLLQI